MTNAEYQQKTFWRMFEEELEKVNNPFRINHRKYFATIDKSSAVSNYCLSMDFLIKKGYLRVGIYMLDDISAFNHMYSYKDEIEAILEFKPMWTTSGEKKDSVRRIEVHIPFIENDTDSYLDTIKKAIYYVKQFKKAMPQYSLNTLFD